MQLHDHFAALDVLVVNEKKVGQKAWLAVLRHGVQPDAGRVGQAFPVPRMYLFFLGHKVIQATGLRKTQSRLKRRDGVVESYKIIRKGVVGRTASGCQPCRTVKKQII